MFRPGNSIGEREVTSFQEEWRILKKLVMDGTPHERLIWKLSLLAVKHGGKPAFFYSEYTSPQRGKLVSDCAVRIGLRPVFCSDRREISELSPVEICRYANDEGTGMWNYNPNDTAFSNRLEAYLRGERGTSQGKLLGYPPCCVQWYEEEVERPQGLEYTRLLRKEELKSVESAKRAIDSPRFRSAVQLQLLLDALEGGPLKETMLKSIKVYPFVPHIACPACLSDEHSSPTCLTNRELAGLASSASLAFQSLIMRNAALESSGLGERSRP